jgi:arylformamidase
MFDRTQLFSLKRGGVVENRIHGEIVVHDGERVIFQTDDVLGQYPMRSLLKPYQFLATGLGDKEIDSKYVPSLGSISASAEQVEYLKKWYLDKKHQDLISKLRLAPCYPADEQNRAKIKEKGEGPSPFFHMCFSKHLAILESCVQNGWDLTTYYQLNHPYHQRLIQIVSEVLETDISKSRFCVDGCKLPSPIFSMGDMAKLYQRLATAEGDTSLHKIQQKMLKHPSWIGGPERIDTLLMQRNPGLIAKEGADGLLGLAILPTFNYPRGLGIVVKIWAGYYPKLAALALVPLFKALGLKTVEEVSSDHQIEFHYEPFQKLTGKYWDISPELSESIAVWPGDVKFQQRKSLDVEQGDHLTLSSFSTTVHVGAHTDALNHFEKNSHGIEAHSLNPYWGSCQVMEVKKTEDKRIEISDIQNKKILAQRLLFKTGSFPNPHQFNEDFCYFSPEVIEYLSRHGVILVGIDTPSIDSFHSKELPAHHATAQWGVHILEGVVLDNIEEGMYVLSALPLRIKGSDASPVRAVLTPK